MNLLTDRQLFKIYAGLDDRKALAAERELQRRGLLQ